MKKTFSMTHLIMTKTVKEFDTDNPPSWMMDRENKWWYENHVLKMNIGDNVKSNFWEVVRVA